MLDRACLVIGSSRSRLVGPRREERHALDGRWEGLVRRELTGISIRWAAHTLSLISAGGSHDPFRTANVDRGCCFVVCCDMSAGPCGGGGRRTAVLRAPRVDRKAALRHRSAPTPTISYACRRLAPARQLRAEYRLSWRGVHRAGSGKVATPAAALKATASDKPGFATGWRVQGRNQTRQCQ